MACRYRCRIDRHEVLHCAPSTIARSSRAKLAEKAFDRPSVSRPAIWAPIRPECSIMERTGLLSNKLRLQADHFAVFNVIKALAKWKNVSDARAICL